MSSSTSQLIEGRKKGGGRGATEASDTLRSLQTAQLGILISEGECVGLVNGMRSVYLDGVPLQNDDGSFNFQDVFFGYTLGLQGQVALDGLSTIQSEVGVMAQIDQASPVTRTVTDPAVDHVRVTIGVPQLTKQDPKTGDLNGSEFEWAIEVQTAGAGFVEAYRGKVSGKSTARYARSVRVALLGTAPWDLRVRRISPDPPTSNIVNRFSWDSFTEITSVKLSYPNSSVSSLRVNAKNFGRVPVQQLDWLGIKMRVPSNYDSYKREYSGIWDGTWKLAWTNNPAWVFLLFATHERFGLGRFIGAEMPNKWALYEIARYCDELVPDGHGGVEPRFTCNVYLQTRRQAFELLRDLAATFRGMAFWSGGGLEFAQDAPADPEILFTPANVVDGRFSYADAGERQQHSVFLVRWDDLSQLGKPSTEVFVDPARVARYGVRDVTLQSFGCTSRGQAARIARWASYSEEHDGEVVTFEVDDIGALVRPGRVFQVSDPSEVGERLGGRIHEASVDVVTIDADVTLRASETYQLCVLQPTATSVVVERRPVITAAGDTRTLAVGTPFSAAPASGSVWILESSGVVPTTWRCLEVQEKGERTWQISGVRHNPGKYALIEYGLQLDELPTSRFSRVPPRPGSVSITETPYLIGSITRSRVTIGWPEPGPGLTYLVSWRFGNGNWMDMPATSATSADVDNLARGDLSVQVRSRNAAGVESPPAVADKSLVGKVLPPGNVTGFAAVLIDGGVKVSWDANQEDDYLTTEVRIGDIWETSSPLFEGAASGFLWPWPAIGNYRLLARHWDTSLGASAAAATAVVNVTSAVSFTRDSALAANAAAQMALGQLGELAADGKLTPTEKQMSRLHWDGIQDERPTLHARANAFGGAAAELHDYEVSYQQLSGYLGPLLADLTVTSDIVGSTYRYYFAALYASRQRLQSKLWELAGQRAVWSGVSGVEVQAPQIVRGAVTRTYRIADGSGPFTPAGFMGIAYRSSDGAKCSVYVPAQERDCEVSVSFTAGVSVYDANGVNSTSSKAQLLLVRDGGATVAETPTYYGPAAVSTAQVNGTIGIAVRWPLPAGVGHTIGVSLNVEGVSPGLGSASLTGVLLEASAVMA